MFSSKRRHSALSSEVTFPFCGTISGLLKLHDVWGNYSKKTQRKIGSSYTVDTHCVTEIKEVTYEFSLMNIFFP
jgi:hypothetical protein